MIHKSSVENVVQTSLKVGCWKRKALSQMNLHPKRLIREKEIDDGYSQVFHKLE